MQTARKKITDNLVGLGHTKFFLFTVLIAFLILNTLRFTFISDISAGSTTTLAVLPQARDYQLSISQNVGDGPVAQGTDITYTVTYGALRSSSFTFDDTLTVNFGNDTIDGITPVADYVPASATSAYNNAPPVVDFVNKTLTWHISQLPAGTTDQIVTFKLKTNSNYTGPNKIPIIVTANFSNQYMSVPQQSTTTYYGYHIYSSAPQSTATPTPVPPSVTPTPTPNPLAITSITFTQITPNEVTIHIGTSEQTRLSALYGLSLNTLFQVTSDNSLTRVHDLHLAQLSPQTQYYLKVSVTNENGESINSDVITFKTAKSSSPIHLDQQSVILISGNNPLISTNPLLPFASVFIPAGQPYTIGLKVIQPDSIKSIATLIENARVLAANTFSSNLTVWSAPMLQEQPGVFVAQLISPPTPSTYDVFAQVSDISGNITQTKIAEATVYGPIHVIDQSSKNGIEHARIFFSLYDTSKKNYEPILSSQFQENPIFTDKDGLAQIKNGAGKYKISVSQYGYKAKDIYFTIDKSHIFPPTVTLTHNGFNILDVVQYYGNTASDFIQNIIASLQNVSSAPRYFKLISILVLASFVIVTFMLFLIRTRLSIFVIPIFIRHHVQRFGMFHGQILDGITHQPIAQAIVAISNRDSHEVLVTTMTNNNGIFYLDSKWASSENIINILASGYRTNKFAINKDLFPATFYLHHNLVGGPLHNPLVASTLHVFSLFFEATLVVSFILELFFIPTVGVWGLMFVGLSLFTLLLWILYQRENKI